MQSSLRGAGDVGPWRGRLPRLLLGALLATAACAPPCAGVSGACVALHIDGEGSYDEVDIEWRVLFPELTPESPGLRAWVEDSLLPGPLTLPADVQLIAPPFLPAGQLHELGVRLRSHAPGRVAAGAIALHLPEDGHADAALSLRWYFERRDLQLSTPAAGMERDLVAADFDQDRHPDLAVLRNGRVQFLYGDGSGQFTEGTPTTQGVGACTLSSPCPQRLRALDINQDKLPDLVISERSNGELLTYLNPGGRASFNQRLTNPLKGEVEAMAVGQFDGMPAPDLAVVDRGTEKIILLTSVASDLQELRRLDTFTAPLQAEPINLSKDQLDDLIVADCSDTQPAVDVLVSSGAGVYAMKTTRLRRKTPCFLAVSDWDGTGRPQALLGMREEHSLLRVLVGADGSLSAQETYFLALYAGNFAALAPADVNADARPDLLVSYAGTPMVGILSGGDGSAGGVLSPAANLDASPAQRGTAGGGGALAVADFDGDGRLDIAMASQATEEVVVFLNRTPQGLTGR